MASVKGKKKSMAEQADRHEYYEASVQDTESELEFVSETFEQDRKSVV